MTRRTLDDTRQLLVDVGLRLLHERGVSVSVTHIRLTEVVAAAGMTTGAAYRCWENQGAYHRDLAVAAAQWRDRASVQDTVDDIADLVAGGAPIGEVLRVAAEANLYTYPEDTPFLTTIALRTCAPADPAVAAAGRRHLSSAVDSFASLYDSLLRVYGRRVAEPYTLRDLTVALAALSEGFVLQAITGEPQPRIIRGDVEAGVDKDWSLFGCAAEAIVMRFTEPDPAGRVDPAQWRAPVEPSSAASGPAPPSPQGPTLDTDEPEDD
jgi:AcrR family transcriptional regulator